MQRARHGVPFTGGVLPPELVKTLRTQRDLMTRDQARAAGLTDAAIRWGLTRWWHSVLPGVIHTIRNPLTWVQKLIAGLLYAGPQAVVTGLSAASWYGIEHADDGGIVRLLVPSTASTRTVRWVSIRRTRAPFDHYIQGPLRFVSQTRAVVEAAREARGPELAEAIVIEAVQRRLVRLVDLASMNDLLGRRGSRMAERAIGAAADGAWSIPESGLFRLVSGSRALPEMWCNPDLFTAGKERRLLTPDGWFDDVGVAVMVHSKRYHAGPGWVPTVEKDGDLVAQGIRVLPVAPTSIRSDPRRILSLVEQTYRTAQRGGRRADVVAERWRAW